MKLKLKLGLNNVKKNLIVYIPFILLVSLSYFLIFSVLNLQQNPSLENIKGFRSINQLLSIALPIFIFFFFLLITNVSAFSFKFRSKNYGLYNVLGLSKKDILHVYFVEIITITLIGLALGFVLTFILDQLIYLMFTRLLVSDVTLKYHLSFPAQITSALIMTLLMVISSLVSIKQLLSFNAINLLKDENQGERKPTYNLLVALIGIVLLIACYLYANQIDNEFLKQENIFQLFISIIGVIIATFMIFVSSSNWILALLQKKKSFYYQSKWMILISNLRFRLKKNAFSLAGITIFSTMAIFVSAVTSMFLISLNQDAPLPSYDVNIAYVENQEFIDSNAILEKLLVDNYKDGVELDLVGEYKSIPLQLFDTELYWENTNQQDQMIEGYTAFAIIPLDSYNQLMKTNLSLADNEFYLLDRIQYSLIDENYAYSKFNEQRYELKDVLDIGDLYVNSARAILLNQDDIDELVNKIDEPQMVETYHHYVFNLLKHGERVNDDTYFKFTEDLNLSAIDHTGYMVAAPRMNLDEMTTVFSGLLFIGFYFILIFLLSLFSLLYFKFFQEALQDRKRFVTLNQVGLSPKESRKTMDKQIQVLFFFPLILSLIHIFFARKGIEMIQMLFGFGTPQIRINSILLSALIFTLIYILLYILIKKLVHKLITL